MRSVRLCAATSSALKALAVCLVFYTPSHVVVLYYSGYGLIHAAINSLRDV
jgi:hypothetical protein